MTTRLFLCGDVMTGRGIDQVLAHPGDPTLHEPCALSALEYVELAESRSGPIPRPQDDARIWGEGLGILQTSGVDLKLINLETAATVSDDFDRGKGIHYRMHPANVGCLVAAGIDCCSLANNHTLDWGRAGLLETLRVLEAAGIATVGAGCNLDEACRPAVFQTSGGGRVLVFGCGCESSGIPLDWAASRQSSGVWLIDESAPAAAGRVAGIISRFRQPRDLVVLSIHWGDNWGYEIPDAHRQLARTLIDCAICDVIHGHSSHHPRAIEIYRGRPILFGCGDLLNDYEGIRGYEEFRPHLGLMHFLTIDSATRRLLQFQLVPTQVRGFRLVRASSMDAEWLMQRLNREGGMSGTVIRPAADQCLEVVVPVEPVTTELPGA